MDAVRADRCGVLVVSEARAYDRSPHHTIIDTGIEADQGFFEVVAKTVGAPVKVGIFRIDCIKALRPVLDHIGLMPKTIFHYIPSIFYYQAARAAK